LRAYRQTFRQHRILLIAPVLLAAVVGGYFTFSVPPMYRSSAALWVDNGSSISSSLTSAMDSATLSDPLAEDTQNATDPSAVNAPSGPAPLESEVVSELLLTSGFDLAVTHGTESHGMMIGFSPLDVRAFATGPQVLQLSYDGLSPVAARTILESLIKQLGAAGADFGDGIGKTASTLYRHKLTAAKSVLAGNQGALTAYASSHPWANVGNDATYRELTTEVQLAQTQLAAVQAASSAANVEAEDKDGSATLEVLDQPSLPVSPTTGMASRLSGFISGAFAGIMLSLLALLLITPRPPIRWDAEVPVFARIAAWDRRGRRRRSPARSPALGAPRPRAMIGPHQEGG
jgi:hypothetical protein